MWRNNSSDVVYCGADISAYLHTNQQTSACYDEVVVQRGHILPSQSWQGTTFSSKEMQQNTTGESSWRAMRWNLMLNLQCIFKTVKIGRCIFTFFSTISHELSYKQYILLLHFDQWKTDTYVSAYLKIHRDVTKACTGQTTSYMTEAIHAPSPLRRRNHQVTE